MSPPPILAALALNLPLALNAWMLARRWRSGRLDFCLAVAIWASVLVTAEMLFLGVFMGRLGFWTALGLRLGVLVLSWFLVGRGPSRREPGAISGAGAPAGAEILAAAELPGPSALAALWLGWLAVLAIATLGLILPPWGYDELMYHLYLPAYWLKTGRIAPFPAYEYLAYWVYYPAGGELLFLWGLLTGSDLWVDLIQLGAALVGAAAVYGLVRVLGAGRSSALLGAGLFFFTPMVLIQAKTTYVDVLYSASFLTAAYFILRSAELGRRDYLFLAGLAAGLMVGIKGNGPLYLVFLSLLLVPGWFGGQTVQAKKVWAKMAADLVTLIIPAVLVGGYWYARNLILTGTPVYPFSLRMPGGIGFSGPLETGEFLAWGQEFFVERASDWLLYPLLDQAIGRPFYGIGTGLGPQFLAFAVPALAVFPLVLAGRGSDRRAIWGWIILGFIPLGLAAFLWLQPFKDGRYLLPLVGPAAVILGLVLDGLPFRVRELAGWTLVFCFGFSLAASLPQIMPAGNRFALRELRDRRAVLDSHQLYGLGWGPMGRGWFYLDRLSDEGSVVAYDGLTQPYPLFGRRLQNQVYYLPPEAPGGAEVDAREWHRRLRAAGAEWLYLTTDSRGWGPALAAEGLFFPVFAESHRDPAGGLERTYGLFRVRDEEVAWPEFPGPPVISGWVPVLLWLVAAGGLAGTVAAAVGLNRIQRLAWPLGGARPSGGGKSSGLAALVFVGLSLYLLYLYLDRHQELWKLAGLWWKFLLGQEN